MMQLIYVVVLFKECNETNKKRNWLFLVARLAICSYCILSICNIYLFPALVLRAGFAF